MRAAAPLVALIESAKQTPSLLPSLLQGLTRTDPPLVALVQANQADFMALLNGSAPLTEPAPLPWRRSPLRDRAAAYLRAEGGAAAACASAGPRSRSSCLRRKRARRSSSARWRLPFCAAAAERLAAVSSAASTSCSRRFEPSSAARSSDRAERSHARRDGSSCSDGRVSPPRRVPGTPPVPTRPPRPPQPARTLEKRGAAAFAARLRWACALPLLNGRGDACGVLVLRFVAEDGGGRRRASGGQVTYTLKAP